MGFNRFLGNFRTSTVPFERLRSREVKGEERDGRENKKKERKKEGGTEVGCKGTTTSTPFANRFARFLFRLSPRVTLTDTLSFSFSFSFSFSLSVSFTVYRDTHQCFPTLRSVRHRSNPLFAGIISSTYTPKRSLYIKRFYLRILLKSKRTMPSATRRGSRSPRFRGIQCR